MTFILHNGQRLENNGFDTEQEFEAAVVANAMAIFGADTVYIDTKRLIGRRGSWSGGIPDGYLIDLSDPADPELYIVENELATHDVYAHIAEQIMRFLSAASAAAERITLRRILTEFIRADQKILDRIEEKLTHSTLHNLDDLLSTLTEKTIRVVVVIDEENEDLNRVLSNFRNRPDVAVLQRFGEGQNSTYVVQPMRDEIEQVMAKGRNAATRAARIVREFDTIVCPAEEGGFKRAYENESAWWAVRISQEARERLKYLAIYQKKPIGEISHVADIDRIEPYENTGKYKVFLKNKRRIGPITLDDMPGAAPQGPRFTTLTLIEKAKNVSDLWN